MTAKKGKVIGAKMYQMQYASTVLTKDPSDSVIGYVLTHHDPEVWKRKLEHYDGIEDFKPDDYENSWYKRDVVTAKLDEGGEVKTFIYHILNPDTSIPVPDGDWLKRTGKSNYEKEQHPTKK